MHTNSTIYIRSRASLSLSFSDPHHHPSSPYSYTSCCSSFSSSASCFRCCCSCCSSSPPLINAPPFCQTNISRIVPINPRLLYGLRQSTLIQWPSCRRRSILITTRFDRPCYGATIYDLGRTTRSSFYGDSFVCCAKGKDSEGESKRDRKCTKKGQLGSGRRKVFEHKNEIISRRESAAREDAESILSLLTEDVDEELLVEIREKKRVAKGSSARKKKLLTTQRENAVMREGSKGRKVKEEGVCVRPPLKRDSRVEMIDSVRVSRHSNEEDYNRRRDERHDAVKGEDWRTRKGGSSHSSSYYTCSDPEHDYVSDEAGVQAKDDSVYKLEGSVKARKDSRKRVGVVITEQGNDGSPESHRREKDQHLESSCRRNNDVKIGTSAEWDWRKKSEKKLSEESATVVDQSKSPMAYASSPTKALSSKTQYNNYRGDVLISGVNTHEESREKFYQTGIRGYSDSRYNYERVTQTSDHINQRISTVSNQFVGKKETCAYCKTCGQRTTDDKNQISSSFEQAKVLDYQEMNAELISAEERESEFHSSRREENSGLLKSSVNQNDVQRCQEHHTLVSDQQKNVSRASLKDSSIVNVGRVSTEDSSSDQQAKYSQIETSSAFTGLSETRIKKRHEEQNSTLLQTSVKDGNHHQQHHIDQPFLSGEINLIRQNQMQTRITNFGESYAENTSNPQQLMGILKHSGENSSSLAPFQPAKAQQNPVGAPIVLQNDSKTGVEGALITYGGNSEHGMYHEHIHLREKVKTLEHHRIEKHELINERVKQSNLSYETQGPIREASFLEGVATTRRQPSLASTSQLRLEEVSEEEGGEKSWKRRLPSSQTTNRDNELASEFARGDSIRSQGQLSQASSSQIRVEEIEEEGDGQESLVKRLPSHRSTKGYPVSVDLAGGYIRKDSGWSSQQLPQTSSSQVGVEEIREEEDERNSQVILPPPGDQTVERHLVESAGGVTRQDYGRSSEGGPSIFFYPETATPPPVKDKAGGIGTFKEPPYLIPDVDVIGSAKRMEQLSFEVAEEFLENARHQASTSLNQFEETLPQRQTVHGGLEYEEKMYYPSGSASSQLKQVAAHTSCGSREYDKGLADAMWSATDPALIEIPKKESSYQDAGSTPGNTAVQRRGRSLWNILGNIIRLRWDSHTASAESGVKTSSDDSASTATEAWFDPDETHVSDRTRAPPSVREELSSSADQPSMRTPVQSRMEGSAMMSSDDRSGVASQNASSSTGLASSLASGGGILVESIDLDAGEQTSTGITSVDMSLPLVSQLGRSHKRSQANQDISLEGKEVIGGVQAEQVDQSHHLRLEGVSMSVEADVEMRQGKLLRNKQVMRETFDEWEEAYRWESHQRKVDEVFMREALVEAKKAADLWEVPVGAVLVQEGKIIARGHNLVEELRDSTAHAEMICIREASNALRTWRLSEATLYVTLEPCPMCAGAILQARITTLVYGAPNKLLGADGSWIRLFPGNAEGEGTVGPVHPFHPNMIIRRGILQEECADAMQQFFKLRRKKDKKKAEESGQSLHTKITLHPSKMMHKMRHMFHLFCL